MALPDDHACPQPFQFPFTEASAAGTAIDDLGTDATALCNALTTSAGTLEGDAFAGATADLFRLSCQARLEAAGYGALWLTTERSTLDGLVAQAQTAEADRDTEILACQASHDSLIYQ